MSDENDLEEKLKDRQGQLDLLFKLMDFQDEDTGWSFWTSESVNDWEKNFSIDLRAKAEADKNFVPTEKQLTKNNVIVTKLKLEYRRIKDSQ